MNIEFRKWEDNDAQELANLANEREVSQYLRDVFPYPYSLDDAKSYLSFLKTITEEQQFNRAVIVNNKIVGSCSLVLQGDICRKSAEIGYWIGKKYWHQGIATELVKKLCEYGFENYDIVRIYGEIFEPNIASGKVLEKNGFQLEGTLRKSVFKNNTFMNTLIYAKIQ